MTFNSLFGNVMNPSALELNAVAVVLAGFFVTAASLFSSMM
ncbi:MULTISPECIES: hypothetical protein [Myxococcaceae]|nr:MULTISPECIES: hypothetical protein [Myxococcaceae]